MKQYKDVPTNFPCYDNRPLPFASQKHDEVLLNSSYDKMRRDVRRAINKSAEKWWRIQVASPATHGMPWLYHCGGVH